MPRHQLTPAERQRGHKLTREDRAKGGRNVPKSARAKAGHATAARLVEAGVPHRFTSESARAASLKRWALKFPGVQLAQRAAAPSPEPAGEPIPPCAASMGCLCAGHARGNAVDQPCDTREVEPVDPFTLSALKRFRLGPVSPFQLTRSQRGHVEIMRTAGLIERTADDYLALTEKGRQALGEDEG